MRVIPVLDVKDGKAVHAVAGRRDRYQLLRTWLCTDGNPVQAASSFKNVFGFRELYVADLEAITGGKPNLRLLEELIQTTGLRLLVDAGIRKLSDALAVTGSGAFQAVIGTETLNSLKLVEESVKRLGAEKVVVSLDTEEGKILSPSPTLRSLTPAKLAEALEALGVAHIVLLDLSRVGTARGVNLDLLKEVSARVNVEVLVGGGVRSLQDLRLLMDFEVEGVLVASALHSRELTPSMLRAEGFLLQTD